MNKLKAKFAHYTKKDYLKMAYHVFLIVVGNLSLAFGTAAFLVPNNIVTGGLSGIAIVVQQLFFASTGSSYIDLIVLICNWLLFFIGLIFLGKKFSIQTLLSVIIYPLALSLMMRVFKVQDWCNFNMTESEPVLETLLAAICGSVFVGLGCAITFKGGGSTGGLDVLTFITQKYLKIKASITSFVLDAIVILCGLFVFKNFAASIIGIMGAFTCALMIEKIFIGYSSTYMATIISEKYEEISAFILLRLERGCTIIEGVGGFSKESRKLLQVAFDRKEYTILLDNIAKIDPDAFVTVILTNEVNGEGFNSFPKRKL